MPLGLVDVPKPAHLPKEFFQVSTSLMENGSEAGHQVVVSGDGIELGVIERFSKPGVIAGPSTPLFLEPSVTLTQLSGEPVALLTEMSGFLNGRGLERSGMTRASSASFA